MKAPSSVAQNSLSGKAIALRGVSFRALLLGLLLTIPNTFWITVVEVRWYTRQEPSHSKV